MLPVLASLLVWPSVSPPPMCLWWIWLSALRNLWVYFTNLHDKNGFSWTTSIWLLLALHVSSVDYRPSMMISRKWSRLQLMDPWKAFWDTQSTKYAHQIVKVVSVKVWKVFSIIFVCAGCVHWLQRGLSLIYLWCWCWHRPQRSLCQAGHMVRFCLQGLLENVYLSDTS